MEFLSAFWSVIAGGGSFISAAAAVAKAATAALAELHDANQRTAGANQVTAADLKSENKFDAQVLEGATRARDESLDDSLRSGNF